MNKKILIFLLIFVNFLCFSSISLASELSGYAKVSGYIKDNVTLFPMEGVKVKLKCGETRLTTYTDSSGYYEFLEIPIYKQGSWYFNRTRILTFIKKYRTEIKRTRLFPGENYTFDFYLDTRFKYPILDGHVIDSSNSEYIEGALVVVSNDNKTYEDETDENGYYKLRIENKRVGRYTVIAKASGYLDSLPENLKTFPFHKYTIDFSLERGVLGVSASPSWWHIGERSPSSITTMSQGEELTVTNTGNINTTYSLMAVNPSGWTISQDSQGIEAYILNAAFSQNLSNINWNETNHALSNELIRSSQTKFSGDQTGENVSPNEEKTLWMQFKAPTSTSVTNEQSIEVIINTEAP